MIDITPSEIAEWVRAAQAGSPEAFGKLHRRFVALVHGVLLSRFRPAVAEELTQECFLIAFQKLPQLRDALKFGPWIAAIARRLKAQERSECTSEEGIDIADTRQNPESSAEAERILIAIHQLPMAYREALVLRLVEGMDGAEIAAAIGLSPESVRVNLHRGLKKLRELLDIQADVVDARAESP